MTLHTPTSELVRMTVPTQPPMYMCVCTFLLKLINAHPQIHRGALNPFFKCLFWGAINFQNPEAVIVPVCVQSLTCRYDCLPVTQN